MGRLLLVAGLAIAGVGALLLLGVPLGRLPGDLVFRRGTLTIYIPLATSLLVSVALTVIMLLLRR